MRRLDLRKANRLAVLVCTAGVVGQFGSCDLGQITTTQTLDGREVVLGIIRSAIITPLDQWVTQTINDAFAEES